ncbi:MAG: Arm DNA-binding domain-containing protein [Chitinophagaceae bacterium]
MYWKKIKITRHELVPLYKRVAIAGNRFEEATDRHVEPTQWSSSSGKPTGRSDSAVVIKCWPVFNKPSSF